MKSNYCDLTRHAAEIAALEASADRTSGGLIANGPDMTVLSTLEVGELGGPKIRSWRESSPDEGDPFWLAIVSRHRQHA